MIRALIARLRAAAFRLRRPPAGGDGFEQRLSALAAARPRAEGRPLFRSRPSRRAA